MYVKIIHFFIQLAGWTTMDLERLERTNGNCVGISWEKLGTFSVDN